MRCEFFPEALLALDAECRAHDKLADSLHHCHSMEEKLATVAAYCGIALDGMYSVEDQIRLADTCTTILRNKRSIILRA